MRTKNTATNNRSNIWTISAVAILAGAAVLSAQSVPAQTTPLPGLIGSVTGIEGDVGSLVGDAGSVLDQLVVDGEGTIASLTGGTATFDVTADADGIDGALFYSDPSAGITVVSTDLADSLQLNPTTDQLVYNAIINGVAGTVTVTLQSSNGSATFSISTSTGYSASGTLESGDILLAD